MASFNPANPAHNPILWKTMYGVGNRATTEIEEIEIEEVAIMSNNYDYEIIIYPMEAQCVGCNFRAYYKGMEYGLCPKYGNNNRHRITFRPVGKKVFQNVVSPEERMKNVECNFCKKLFSIKELHNCPEKPFKGIIENQYRELGWQCANCLRFWDAIAPKTHVCVPRNLSFNFLKDVFAAKEAYAAVSVNETTAVPNLSWIESGVVLFFIVIALLGKRVRSWASQKI